MRVPKVPSIDQPSGVVKPFQVMDELDFESGLNMSFLKVGTTLVGVTDEVVVVEIILFIK
jgi:hypothetical protein